MSSNCPICGCRVPVDQDGKPCGTECRVQALIEGDGLRGFVAYTERIEGLLREAREIVERDMLDNDGRGSASGLLRRIDEELA